jgi:hypothetical protein
VDNPDEADLDTDADLENADLDDFGEPDDADLQAVLAEEDLGEAGLDDAAKVARAGLVTGGSGALRVSVTALRA